MNMSRVMTTTNYIYDTTSPKGNDKGSNEIYPDQLTMLHIIMKEETTIDLSEQKEEEVKRVLLCTFYAKERRLWETIVV